MSTQDKIKVMQAAVEGKVIEQRVQHGWEVVENPAWDWLDNNYRVKPRERRKYWLRWDDDWSSPTVAAYNPKDIEEVCRSNGFILLEEPLD